MIPRDHTQRALMDMALTGGDGSNSGGGNVEIDISDELDEDALLN